MAGLQGGESVCIGVKGVHVPQASQGLLLAEAS